MSVASRDLRVETGEHVVAFYDRDSDLATTVGQYLVQALQAGEIAVVIATEAHRGAFEQEIVAAGLDLAQVRKNGTYIALDAAKTMSMFMINGSIDSDAFHRIIGGAVREGVESGRQVRAYGEMVALLWDAGQVPAAIELETLWNDLGRELPFSLFCAYPRASVEGSEHSASLDLVCHLHSSVLKSPTAGTDLSAEFSADLAAPRAARRFLVETLTHWGCSQVVIDQAALVVTELATNAVLHAGSAFTVTARLQEGAVHLAVHDADTLPSTADRRPSAEAGRGLGVVAALATRWGVDPSPDGKVIWADLPA